MRPAVQIPRRDIPMLPLASIHREFDGMAIGAMKGFVAVQDCLNIVFAGRDVAEVAGWIAVGIVVGDDNGLARSEPVDVNPEHQLCVDGKTDLHARLLRWIGREQDKDPPIQRLGAAVFGK